MAFLPDTNVWISLLKNPGGKLDAKVRTQPVSDIFLCAVVKAELWHGAEKYGNRERRRRALEMLFAPFASLPFDDAAARHYAEIRHQLEIQGRVIGPNDLKSRHRADAWLDPRDCGPGIQPCPRVEGRGLDANLSNSRREFLSISPPSSAL